VVEQLQINNLTREGGDNVGGGAITNQQFDSFFLFKLTQLSTSSYFFHYQSPNSALSFNVARAMSQELNLPTLSEFVTNLIPQDETSLSALALAHKALSEPVLNHSLRVFLIAKYLSKKEGTPYAGKTEESALFVAAICHDLGSSDLYNGSQRFEVEGADAAKAHLISHGGTPERGHQVWVAIALHTSPGIAERIDPFTRLLRVATSSDFSWDLAKQLDVDGYRRELEENLPRLEVERCLADAVVNQAVDPQKVDRLTWPNTQKHPLGSWPGGLLRGHLENPNHDGVNPAF
jgi:hypothetical protein